MQDFLDELLSQYATLEVKDFALMERIKQNQDAETIRNKIARLHEELKILESERDSILQEDRAVLQGIRYTMAYLKKNIVDAWLNLPDAKKTIDGTHARLKIVQTKKMEVKDGHHDGLVQMLHNMERYDLVKTFDTKGIIKVFEAGFPLDEDCNFFFKTNVTIKTYEGTMADGLAIFEHDRSLLEEDIKIQSHTTLEEEPQPGDD